MDFPFRLFGKGAPALRPEVTPPAAGFGDGGGVVKTATPVEPFPVQPGV